MDTATALWHVANFFAAAAGFGLIASALAKLLWTSALRGTSMLSLWAWTGGASALVSIAGLVAFGRDGKIVTYAAMVLVCSLLLWHFTGRRGKQ